MGPADATGDLALIARLATAEAFAPYGALFGLGDRLRIGRRSPVLVALDEERPGPRRFTHLQRYAHAQRLVLPLGETQLLLLVLDKGGPGGGLPIAFRTVAGCGLLIAAGVWHAGPVALADGILLEALETSGPADRLDRRPLADLAGVPAVRIGLPEEPGISTPGLDLGVSGALLFEEDLTRRLTVGLLLLGDLEVEDHAGTLDAVIDEVVRSRPAEEEAPDPTPAGLLWGELGLDESRYARPPRGLLADRVAGRSRAPSNLQGALDLVQLRREIPLQAYDAARLSTPLQMRLGRPSERISTADGQRRRVGALPVLADADGLCGTLVTAARRTHPGPGVSQVLVVCFLPAGTAPAEVEAHLDAISDVVRAHCKGHEVGRLVPDQGRVSGA